MNPLLYYPFFEVKDQEWLKFALLYLKDIKIIMPKEGEQRLTNEFWEIYNSTDLFSFHRPQPNEGYQSSLDTIESIEPILVRPELYSKRFNIHSGTETIVGKWRNRENQSFEIYHGKYSEEFLDYCMNNNFAVNSENGMLLPMELALIYMSFLANVIGAKTERSPITDVERYDYLINEMAKPSNTEEKLILAKNIINVKIPKNINKIGVEEILKLRSSNGFITNLNAFHIALDSFHSRVEEGKLTSEFLSEYEDPFMGLTAEVKSLSLDLTNYGIGTFMVLSDNLVEIPNIIKTAVVGGLALYTGNKIKTKMIWQNTKNKFKVRRYLTSVKNMS